MKKLSEFGYVIENNEFEVITTEGVEIISIRYEEPNKIYCVISRPVEGISPVIMKKFKFYEVDQEIDEDILEKYWGSYTIDGTLKHLFELNT
jgi:hypothetical protein